MLARKTVPYSFKLDSKNVKIAVLPHNVFFNIIKVVVAAKNRLPDKFCDTI